MSRASAAHNPGVSLFPFLAVLICTMGVMMLLLVIINRPGAAAIDDSEPPPGAIFEVGGKGSAATVAIGDGGAASGANDELQRDREMLNWRISQLKISREKTIGDLRDERLRLTTVEEGMRKLRGQWELAKKAADDIEQADKTKDHAKQAAAAFVDRLKSDLKATRERIGNAIDNARSEPPAYAIVPYDGPNGTRRQPIYIECRNDAIVLQPEGIVLTARDFEGPKGPGNPLASTIRAARDYLAGGTAPVPGREPYPLLIVRSDGVEAFYIARPAMSSWASDFGYELIEADRKLVFQAPDPQLAQVEKTALADARSRYAWFATTRTGQDERQPRDRPVYRVSGTGGIKREGQASLDDLGDSSTGSNAGNSGFGAPTSRFTANGNAGGSGGTGTGNGIGTGNSSGTGNGTGATGGTLAGGPGSSAAYVPGSNYIGLPGSGGGSGSDCGTGGSGYGTGGTGYGPSGSGIGIGGSGNGTGGSSSGVPGGMAGAPGVGSTTGSGTGTGVGSGNGTSGGPAFVPGTGYIGLPGSGGASGTPGGPAGYGPGNSGSGTGTSGGGTGTPGAANSGYAGMSGSNGTSGAGTPGVAGGAVGTGVPNGNALTGPALTGPYSSGTQNGSFNIGPGSSGTNSTGSFNGNGSAPGTASAGQSGPAGAAGGMAGDPNSMPPPGTPTGNLSISQTGGASGASASSDAGGDSAALSGMSSITNGKPQSQQSISDVYNIQATPYPLQSGPTGPHPGEFVDSQPITYPDKPKPQDDIPSRSHDSLAEKRGHNWSLPSQAKLATPVSRTIHIECRGDRLILKPDFSNPQPRVIVFGPRTADSVDKLVAAVWDYTKGWGIAGRQMYWRPRLELELGLSGEGRYSELQALLADSGLEVARKQPTTVSATQLR